MLYIDKRTKDGKDIRYYFGNTSTYREALKDQSSTLKVMQLAESAVDRSSNEILKCRHMVKDVFDKYYEIQAFENAIIHE